MERELDKYTGRVPGRDEGRDRGGTAEAKEHKSSPRKLIQRVHGEFFRWEKTGT